MATDLYLLIGASVAGTTCFGLALIWMGRKSTVRRGVLVNQTGFLLAIITTLMLRHAVGGPLVAGALLIGCATGFPLGALTPIREIPQRPNLPLLSLGNIVAGGALVGAIAADGGSNATPLARLFASIAIGSAMSLVIGFGLPKHGPGIFRKTPHKP